MSHVVAMRGALHFIWLAGVMLLAACSGSSGIPEAERAEADWDATLAAYSGAEPPTWSEDVQPLLEQRCVVCHGCYDAPCQLKLTSYEGVTRGANPAKVYDGARISAAEPTRLYIDAGSPAEWRTKGFHSVLDGDPATGKDDPRNSVLYRMLRLKQLNPQPRTGLLPAAMTTKLDRKQVCTTNQEIARFERDNPLWGMPYAMPNLADEEYRTLVNWLAAGAPGPAPAVNSPEAERQIVAWETFLNGGGKRQRLVSRYVYEHLFLGHLHFEGAPDREFYRLVRSTTPPGQPISEIATVRPFDDPGVDEFWYRLRRYEPSIVAKAHVVYPLSDTKLARYRELFLEPDYEVSELPGYALPDAANPFIVYADIPPLSRYQFMLDDARFFIQGFIKGPVCRGQVALNVIEDHFWVMFANPLNAGSRDRQLVLNYAADYLQMPSSTDTLRLLATYTQYWQGQKRYLAAKTTYLRTRLPNLNVGPLELIWDGDGANPNAALTVFRNFDSAAVEFGWLGKYPETAWVIDYPLFERIHYLLVAAFDVYGNIGHQLNSRLFMDFLRMEGEDNFLLLLPPEQRKRVRDNWYQGIRERRQKYFQEPMGWLDVDLRVPYQTADYQRELYDMLLDRLGPLAGPPDDLNRCADGCVTQSVGEEAEADRILRRLTEIRGERLQIFPDVAFIRVLRDGGDDLQYTMIYNKEYQNLSSVLEDGSTGDRDTAADSVTLLRGFSGSYPNFFFAVPFDELEAFVQAAEGADSVDTYQALVGRFGVRRTDARFWQHADWFSAEYARQEPLEAGIFDLNRYVNR